jgi:hypothetical protein
VKLHRLLPSDRPEPAAMISRAGRGSGAHASRGGRGAGKPPGSLTEVTLPGVTLNPLGLGLVVGRSLKGGRQAARAGVAAPAADRRQSHDPDRRDDARGIDRGHAPRDPTRVTDATQFSNVEAGVRSIEEPVARPDRQNPTARRPKPASQPGTHRRRPRGEPRPPWLLQLHPRPHPDPPRR